MTEINKTLLGISIAFAIAFTSLFFFISSFTEQYSLADLLNKDYLLKLNDTKKVFIIGSSQVVRIDTSYIDTYLNGTNYGVYNLGKVADTTSQRLKTIDDIIALKPSIIAYGVGFTDFEKPLNSTNSMSNNVKSLPDPQHFFKNNIVVGNWFHYDFSNFKSPLGVTVKYVTDVIYQLIPGYKTSETATLIMTRESLQADLDSSPPYRGVDVDSQNIKALKIIITKIQENNIKVILFSTPHSKIYLDRLSNYDKNTFEDILNEIGTQYSVPVYFFHDKYQSLDIWLDNTHMSPLKMAPYELDLAKAIQGTIDH